MERLTTKVDNLYQTNDKFTPLLGIKRLGEYEDTGLTPEEIENLKVELKAMRGAANSLKLHYQQAKAEAIKEFAERLKEYELCMFCSFPDNKSLGSEQYIVLSDSIDELVKEIMDEELGRMENHE